jgi:hypothetical protein
VKRALFLTGLSATNWERLGRADISDMMRAMTFGRRLCVAAVLAVVVCGSARAENLDEGKSGAQLFAGSCVTCHHRAKGLTHGRFRLSLYFFLQQHYASNSSAAWELASYLESVDEAPRGRPRPAAAKRPQSSRTAGDSLRPPAPIPQR